MVTPRKKALEEPLSGVPLINNPLIKLGGGLSEAPSPARLATGLAAVDRLLGGGFPRGRLSEIAGPLSSGRTSLAAALLAEATRAGEVAAWVDAADALDPASLDQAGVDLCRLLWVRAPGARAALRSAERLLEARGFAIVVLDLSRPTASEATRPLGVPPQAERPRAAERAARRSRAKSKDAWPLSNQPVPLSNQPVPLDNQPVPLSNQPHPLGNLDSAVWMRLARRASASGTALVLLGAERCAGPFSALVVDLRATRLHFAASPAWLEGLEARLAIARHRLGPAEGSVPVCWKVPPVARGVPARSGSAGGGGGEGAA